MKRGERQRGRKEGSVERGEGWCDENKGENKRMADGSGRENENNDERSGKEKDGVMKRGERER